MAALLEATQVAVKYQNASGWALSGASLEVFPGDTVGVVGESGSGKSTFAKTLVGALAPTEGKVLVDGRPWSEIGRKQPERRRVQMIFQDPYSALNPHMSALRAVAEVVAHWEGVGRRDAEHQAREILLATGLRESDIRKGPRQLSGGQCQRVGIARALACNPSVLVADEPTSSLDASVQSQILNVLISLRDVRQVAIVLISHDLGVIRHMTDRALVMRGGRVVEEGKTAEIFAAPKQEYTRMLLSALPGKGLIGSGSAQISSSGAGGPLIHPTEP